MIGALVTFALRVLACSEAWVSTRLVVPHTVPIMVVEIAEDRADFGAPPINADASFSTGAGVGSNGSAETLAVTATIAGTCVRHTSLEILDWVNHGVTGCKHRAFDYTAMLLPPGLSEGIIGTGVQDGAARTGGVNLPAVSKC